MIEITCPNCSTVLGVDDELSGSIVECAECEALFQVTGNGEIGVPIENIDNINVDCPGCDTVHEVPVNARGVEAECNICACTFQIPMTGTAGIMIAEGNKTAQTEQATEEKEEDSGSFQNVSNTMKINREDLIENTMLPKYVQEERSKRSEGAEKPRPHPRKPAAAQQQPEPAAEEEPAPAPHPTPSRRSPRTSGAASRRGRTGRSGTRQRQQQAPEPEAAPEEAMAEEPLPQQPASAPKNKMAGVLIGGMVVIILALITIIVLLMTSSS